MENGDQFHDDFLMLSLSLPFSEDCVIDAQPISYYLPHQSSSSTSVEFSLCSRVCENHSNPTLSLFPQVYENPSDPNLSLFPQVSENLAASKPIGNNTPPPPPSSIDLCLSLPSASDTFSTITTLQCSIDNQDSSVFASSSREVYALGNCAPKRSLGEEKFVPLKKIKLRNKSTNNPKQQGLIIRQAVAAAAGEEVHWITKKLTRSDVNGASRLLLSRQDVNNYILPFMDEEEQSIICKQLCGIDVTVFDMDTNTQHILTLKKWSTNSFHLVKAWRTDFVKRRNLKEKDVISIRWEKTNSRFCFRVDMRNQVHL